MKQKLCQSQAFAGSQLVSSWAPLTFTEPIALALWAVHNFCIFQIIGPPLPFSFSISQQAWNSGRWSAGAHVSKKKGITSQVFLCLELNPLKMHKAIFTFSVEGFFIFTYSSCFPGPLFCSKNHWSQICFLVCAWIEIQKSWSNCSE